MTSVPGALGVGEALALLSSGLIDPQPSADPFRRPEVVEAVIPAFVAAVRDVMPELVLCWDALDDGLLAHGVARTLGIETSLVYEPQEGVVDLVPPLRRGSRVVLVATVFRRINSLRAPAALVGHRGGTLARVVSLVSSPVAEEEATPGIDYRALVK